MGAGANDIYVTARVLHLLAETRYYYRLVAENASGRSIGATYAVRTSRPDRPGLAVSLVSPYVVDVAWQLDPETAGEVSPVRPDVSRRIDGGPWDWIFPFDKFPRPGMPALDIWFEIQTDHVIDYKVVACNGIGCSDTAYATIQTHALPAPSNLTASTGAPGTVVFNWQDNSTDEGGFRLYRRTVNGEYVRISGAGANETQAVDTTAQLGVTYYYVVRAGIENAGPTNHSGSSRESASSNEVSITLH